jgi:glutamine synthetase
MQPSNDVPAKQSLNTTYEALEQLNLTARAITDPGRAASTHVHYLENEKSVKTVTVCFSDIEGRLHMLDYDKRFLLDAREHLTFDGSSIRGFSLLKESDLRLRIDWTSFTHVPEDIFGPGKVLIFANVAGRDLTSYEADFRVRLQDYARSLFQKDGTTAYMAPELEGYLLEGIDAERRYDPQQGFQLVSTGGYFSSLPKDNLRTFIDRTSSALSAMGFRMEKAHPEVGPSQFEINFSYTDVVRAADQIQLYKLVCRQIASEMGMTACFLPKPIAGINGNGMHANFSVGKEGKNLFHDPNGDDGLSQVGRDMIAKILARAPELCLIFNSSVNSYRRLDPNFEAPNQIKASAIDRGAMIRIPFASENTARIEIRSVSPDTNPYLTLFAILKTGLEDQTPHPSTINHTNPDLLPETISEAIAVFGRSNYLTRLLGEDAKDKYLAQKIAARDRSPKKLGNTIKDSEILFHHEVTNQYLWNQF